MSGLYGKVIVAAMVLYGFAFGAAVLFVNYSGHDVADSLITCTLGFCFGELGFSAWIYNTKTKTKAGAKSDSKSRVQEWFDEHWADGGTTTDNESDTPDEDETEIADETEDESEAEG